MCKNFHFSNLIAKYRNNAKLKWCVIQKDTSKNVNISKLVLPIKIDLDEKLITNTKPIVENCNNFFTDVGPMLSK